MDFRITLFFTYGALNAAPDEDMGTHDFEPRLRDFWFPWAKEHKLSLSPDLVMYSKYTVEASQTYRD